MADSSSSDEIRNILVQYGINYGNDSDDSDDELIMFTEITRWIAESNIIRDGRELETRRRVNRRRERGHQTLWEDYFGEDKVYSEYHFRRRFRMRYNVFNRILEEVCNYDPYFVQKMDACGRLGLSSHQKILGAIRLLANGGSHDVWSEQYAMSETTLLQTVVRFANAIVAIFGAQYSRNPTAEDVVRLLQQNDIRGFPGMLGSIDCMHWQWKNCPTAWHAQYRGRYSHPTIILEAVASYDLWIWKSFFGMPGSCNDLNVLHRSNVFTELRTGISAPINYEINGTTYNMGYYLGDGIYPPYATIVKTFRRQQGLSHAQKLFCTAQESCRKDVERAFGVLQSRFAFVREPCKLWNRASIATIMQACIIMHNMIIDDERRDCEWRNEYEPAGEIAEIQRGQTNFYEYLTRDAQMRDAVQHEQLRNDLVEHIWNHRGNAVDD